MSINIDARGLACPQPLIATKKALESITDGVVTTIVDNVVAKENVVKFATSHQCGVSVEEQEGQFHIKITKGIGTLVDQQPSEGMPESASVVYLITQDTMGHGSKELGAVLIKGFFHALVENQPLPRAVMFINGGVHLTGPNSPVLEQLLALTAKGVQILSCGTCLDYYQIKDKLAVGTITNMYTIVEELSGGSRAITL
jgi:selenium metabolism protein YedF